MVNKLRIDVLRAEIADSGTWLHISAIRGGRCVGGATVFWTQVEGKTPELCNLFVEESARRQGVAAAIIRATASAVDGPFCLHVTQESAAYWLYRKMGFTEVGKVHQKPENTWMVAPSKMN